MQTAYGDFKDMGVNLATNLLAAKRSDLRMWYRMPRAWYWTIALHRNKNIFSHKKMSGVTVKSNLLWEQWSLICDQEKLSLCLIKHHAMNMYRGVESQLHTFIASALHEGEQSASLSDHFIPRKKTPSIPGTERWVGPTATLNAVEKAKISAPARNWHQFPCHPACRIVTILTGLSWFPYLWWAT
jgi:hypothetical protein